MRIAQIAYERTPKRVAPSGGDLGAYQNICALSDLGHEVHLIVLGPRTSIAPEIERRARVHWLAPKSGWSAAQFAARLFNPETVALRFPDARGYHAAIRQLMEVIQPDLVWADSTFALAVAPRDTHPVVFGNYDFLFKLKSVRGQTSRTPLRRALAGRLRARLKRPDVLSPAALEELELRLAREAAHVMCVSASETEYLVARGIPATTIPIVGPTVPRVEAPPFDAAPRLFLFGNHNTAHKAALSEIRHRLWPEARRVDLGLEWHQVGRPPQTADDDWAWMTRSFDRVHGFVDDLCSVFRPGDLSIVPYKHDTGFRTKFTVAAAYGVVSAGYTQSFLCAPEFEPGRDCVSAASPENLVEALQRYAADRRWRQSLADGARALYDTAFTFEAQLPRYERVIAEALGRAPDPSLAALG